MIGIFDSGSGGLTVLKAVRAEMPSADIIYFGDIKNAPYGNKSREQLSVLTVNAIHFLEAQGAARLISACNSVSASLSLSLVNTGSLLPYSLIEMVGPTTQYFKEVDTRVLLVATPATVQSAIYQTAFRMIGKDIDTLPIDSLAGAIEFGEPEDVIKKIIKQAFLKHNTSLYDIIILGCTHYPLVHHLFREVLGEAIGIFDPAIMVAQRAKESWWPQEVGEGTTRFVISKDSEHFRKRVQEISDRSDNIIEVIE